MTQLEALKAIAKRDGGFLRPQAVVDEARAEESPLHGAFEWDDGVAAEKYRLDQAQRLIRSFRVEIETEQGAVEVSCFVNVSKDRTEGSALNPYRMMEDLRESPDLMTIAANDALEQLEALRNRFSYIKTLSDVWATIDQHSKKRKARKSA